MNTTENDVRQFKKLWYEAYTSGNPTKMQVGKNGRGARVIDISPKTSPNALGFPDEQARDITDFQTLVIRLRTCRVFHDIVWKYCDEYLLSMAESFVMEGILKDFTLMSQPIADMRISSLSPAVLVRFIFNEDAYKLYVAEKNAAIAEQTSWTPVDDDIIVIGADIAATDVPLIGTI